MDQVLKHHPSRLSRMKGTLKSISSCHGNPIHQSIGTAVSQLQNSIALRDVIRSS
jgi:hypothetical protein